MDGAIDRDSGRLAWWLAFDAYMAGQRRQATLADLVRALHAQRAGLSPSAAVLDIEADLLRGVEQ